MFQIGLSLVLEPIAVSMLSQEPSALAQLTFRERFGPLSPTLAWLVTFRAWQQFFKIHF